jgi:DNA-directed RNA polymerase subunit alpha
MAESKSSAIAEVFQDAAAGRIDFLNARTVAYSLVGEMETLEKLAAECAERAKSARGDVRERAALNAGVGLWIMRRYKEACEALEPVAATADGAWLLGLCRTEIGDYAGAVRVLQKASDAGQDAFVCAMAQAEALRRAGQREEALAKVRTFQKSHDQEAELHYQKGRLFEADMSYEQAMEAFERAVDLNPQHSGALFRLAYWHDLRGNDDLALDCYEKAAAVRPVHAGALVNLGVIYEDRGEYQKAADLYARILSVDPTNAQVKMYAKDSMSSLDMYYDEVIERRQHRTAALLRIGLSEFDLSARTRTGLEKMNIRTLGDLARLSEQDVANSKNFGDASVTELRALLESKGLHFGMGRIAPEPAALEAPEPSGALAKPVGELDLSVRSLKCVKSLGCETLGDLIQKTEKELLDCPNFGQTSLNEIKRKLAQYNVTLKTKD